MTHQVAAGQIWQVVGSDALALIVCVWEDDLEGADIRVVPVYAGAAYLALATDRDVILPPSESTLGRAVLAACWNGRPLSSLDLGELVGEVSTAALDAVRTVEMVGIVPDVERMFTEWRGAPIDGSDDARLTAQARLLEDWDDLHSRLVRFRRARRMVIPRNAVAAGRLFRGSNAISGPYGPPIKFSTHGANGGGPPIEGDIVPSAA